LDEVNQEITDFGCEVIGQYAVLGSCDFVTVIQAPDNESVAHLSVALGSPTTASVVPNWMSGRTILESSRQKA